MKHDEFVGAVQNRAELASRGEAIRVTRAVLTTLGERLQPGEASDLAGPLPMEIDIFLHDADSGQIFDYDDFVQRVAERANADYADAAFYAQVVMDVVDEAVPESELQDVTAQLPEDYDDLFELVGTDEYY
ncbi:MULTISPECIES: DUF2267 domain-containing protein [Halobacterium]|uniref:DUF2267 domain-containing protein n=1 Tax=Halobacterium TaxID=2239 RepID=UPI00073EA14D|nr:MULTISPECIES: DUF2267 domain-containing protein [Halobacterium]MCG1003400.1 DUF2267 domain-containing protein [Halobacterium noricense]